MLACLLVTLALGCTADVTTTDDSHRIEVQTPKIETGDQKPDLDPGTDDDIDVDTPLPGDR
jgi:hypothetical protein